MFVRQYTPDEVRRVPRIASVSSMKAFCESAGIGEYASYPAHLPALPLVSAWLQRAIVARETAIAYAKESQNLELEVLV